jgi:hypothetical protein
MGGALSILEVCSTETEETLFVCDRTVPLGTVSPQNALGVLIAHFHPPVCH